jgi:hypothetical protein
LKGLGLRATRFDPTRRVQRSGFKGFKAETEKREWILFYFSNIDRIYRIRRIFFCLHQFPKEIDEAQSTFGGEENFRVSKIPCFLRKQRIKNPINPVDPV